MRSSSRAPLALVLALVAGGCSDLFKGDKAPDGYTCSPTNTCPPGQQCVPGEHICRTPCSQPSLATGMTGPMQNNQCNDVHSDTAGFGQFNCDYDRFCRPSCMSGGLNGTCSGCSGTDVCDSTVNICRPMCAGGCPTNWGCTDVSNGTNGNSMPMVCAGCRPLVTSAFLPPTFAPIVFYDTPGTLGARVVTIGDLAGNGRPSVIAIPTSQKVIVYGNDGMGGLTAPVTFDATTGANVALTDVAVADMNRDGNEDVVVARADPSGGGTSFLPGKGDGSLGAIVVGPTLPANRLAVGDFDGDGKPDVAMCAVNYISIVTADGMGGLKQLGVSPLLPSGASYVRVGGFDFNGDKKLDLWGDDMHGSIGTFLSNGNPSSLAFSAGPSVSGGTRTDEALLDVDGDGKDDFVIVGSSPTGPMGTLVHTVVVAKNTGNGSFSIASNTNDQVLLPADGKMVAADFDGDGHTDIAVLETLAGSSDKSAIDFVSGDGSKLIYSEQIAIGKDFPDAIAAGDLDGDGKPDLVIGLSSGGVAVLLNQTM